MRRDRNQKIFYYTHPGIYIKKLEELNSTEEKVCWLLQHYFHLRDCDKCLIKYFHYQVDGYRMELLPNAIHLLTPEETITRVRRKIQNDLGLFLPTQKEIQENRKISEVAVREWAINGKQL